MMSFLIQVNYFTCLAQERGSYHVKVKKIKNKKTRIQKVTGTKWFCRELASASTLNFLRYHSLSMHTCILFAFLSYSVKQKTTLGLVTVFLTNVYHF